MDKKFSDYYESLGMGKLLIEKMSSFHNQFNILMNGQPSDVMVSEYVTEDGQKQYTTASMFTDDYVFEIEKFISDSPKIWVAKLHNNIAHIGMTAKEYDYSEPTAASRLIVECRWIKDANFILDIKASGDNCRHLQEKNKKYIKNNIA